MQVYMRLCYRNKCRHDTKLETLETTISLGTMAEREVNNGSMHKDSSSTPEAYGNHAYQLFTTQNFGWPLGCVCVCAYVCCHF